MAVSLDVKTACDTVSLCACATSGSCTSKSVGVDRRLFAADKNLRTREGDTGKITVSQGVPQRGVLSSLFNTNMVGLRGCIPERSVRHIFADGACIWTTGKSRPAIQKRLQYS